MNTFKSIRVALCAGLAAASVSLAEGEGDASATSLIDALTSGTPSVNARLRYEQGNSEAAMSSEALTLRSRVGYLSGTWLDMQAFVEMEHVEALNDSDEYNQAGLNDGAAGRTVIADVEGTELNQVWLSAVCPLTGAAGKLGRQRVIYSNARFLGNVGWRQNEQTFDAVTLGYTAADCVKLQYAYLWRVNRIFGPSGATPSGSAGNAAHFDSDSHALVATCDSLPVGTVSAYAYLLDLGDAVGAANSSDTFGLRLTGSTTAGEDLEVGYTAELAQQRDNSATTAGTDYEALYYTVDVNCAVDGVGTVGVGQEVLESDDGTAFRTPLATGHKFNGWADVFLVTPAEGLEDTYVYVAGKLPGNVKSRLVYHDFQSNEGSTDYGTEIDAMVARGFGENVTVLAKFAKYWGDSAADNPRGADLERWSVEATLAF